MPKPYPSEVRGEVVLVACDRDPGAMVEQIAKGLRGSPDNVVQVVAPGSVDEGAKGVNLLGPVVSGRRCAMPAG